MGTSIKAKLYMESKIDWKKFVAIHDPDGYLFSGMYHPTKILPEDLPEWYVYGYMYKRHGYISAKGVKYLLYEPNYCFDNHMYKYDSLYISYNNPIKPIKSENGFNWYEDYDYALGGSVLVDFVNATSKYSGYDVGEIQAEIARKRAFYYERNPEQMRTEINFKLPFHGLLSDNLHDVSPVEPPNEPPDSLSKEFGRCLPYRGKDYRLVGGIERKPFFDNCFCVPVTHTSTQIKQDVVRIYRDLARSDLTSTVSEYAEKMLIQPSSIKLNSARTALGRCSAGNNLTFSWRLIMFEDDIISYVIVRALAQMRIPKRSPEYWTLVKSYVPEYKESQRRLQYLLERLKEADWI
jgi:predicted metal-dependent hydrolase